MTDILRLRMLIAYDGQLFRGKCRRNFEQANLFPRR
jgi:hypothetical protein